MSLLILGVSVTLGFNLCFFEFYNDRMRPLNIGLKRTTNKMKKILLAKTENLCLDIEKETVSRTQIMFSLQTF